jgi:hypothetical protein
LDGKNYDEKKSYLNCLTVPAEENHDGPLSAQTYPLMDGEAAHTCCICEHVYIRENLASKQISVIFSKLFARLK